MSLRFLLLLGLGLASAAVSAEVPSACDVLVVGAGPAGLGAALAAAKSGARTVIVERGGEVGGTAVQAGINRIGLFHAWGRQVVDGPVWTVVTNSVALDGGRLPDISKPMGRRHSSHCVTVNPIVYAAVAEEALHTVGVEVRLYSFPVAIRRGRDSWQVDVASDAGVMMLEARQIVDATGNASVAAMVGARRIMEGPASRQPGSCHGIWDLKGCTCDADALNEAQSEAIRRGELLPTDVIGKMSDFVRSGGWANYIPCANNENAATRAETNRRGRAAMLRILRFLKGQPGCTSARIVQTAPETGVRETYRVVGERTITGEDYLSGRIFEDAVCYSYWMIDPHDARRPKAELVYLDEGKVATVPLSALLPLGVENLLVAGRAVSSDHVANSALRVQASCMAMGQAAGVAAALAARRGCDVRKLGILQIHQGLRDLGAVVPMENKEKR